MLVTFRTSAYSDITMFGTAAVSLLKLMGQSGNVPGAILAEGIPEALQTLQAGLAQQGDSESSDDSANSVSQQSGFDDESESKPVSLHTRAGPLINLLEAAAVAGENVQWNK